VLNLARVKLRDQQRLAHGPLTEYSQYGEGIPFGDAVPRAGNDSGGGQPGRILKCKGWETDPNAYLYFITQAQVWEKICDVIGEPGWKTHPDYAKAPARLTRLNEIFARIEPLLQDAPDRGFSEPNRWGTGELAESAVRPELVAEVRYDKVQGNRFRHGSRFLRFRDDKDPEQCTWREVRPPRSANDPTFESLLAGRV